MRRVPLYEIAYSRAGDKGDTSNVSVIPFREEDYQFLCKKLTSERVKRHFGELVKGRVVRYEMPGIKALNFVMERALSGGVSRSLNLDAHGKSWANLMLALELDVDGLKRRSQPARRR